MANKIVIPPKEILQAAYAAIEAKGKDMIPQPVGWRLLIMMPKVEEKTAGGIYLTTNYVEQETVAAPIGLVVGKGPLAYADKKKFPDGIHWCEVGDLVFFRSYAGTRVVVFDYEFRLISDEAIEGVVEDPRGIERI